jgi:Capsule polysaccharide biosynthesis protein
MHIAIFNTHPLFQRHFATELELAQKHLNAGDTVTLLHCDGEMLACETNEEHSPTRCALCRQSREVGVGSLRNTEKLHRRSFLQMTERDVQDLQVLPKEFATLEEMMNYMTDNYDIGSSVLSSLICSLKDSTPDMGEYADVLRRYTIASFIVYRSMRNFLQSQHIDKVYVFNGRMSMTRAILRACEAEKVEFYTHECGNDAKTYATFKNAMPHGIRMMTDLMLEHWRAAATLSNRNEIAAEWFLNRAKGMKVNGYSFVEQQQSGMLPSDRDPNKRHITIFTTGSFEYVTVGEDYKHNLYTSQMGGLRHIVESLAQYKDTLHITVRIHPNLIGLPKDINPVLALKSDFVTVVLPDSPVSTYALLQHTEKVITFHSTVGIEATFWDKPSILAGKSAYQELGSNYIPDTHEELVTLVVQENLPPNNKEGALVYGYFQNTFGTPFEFYTPDTFFGGRFNGRVPMANRWLFRLDTLYKRTAPMMLQNLVTERFTEQMQRTITHT